MKKTFLIILSILLITGAALATLPNKYILEFQGDATGSADIRNVPSRFGVDDAYLSLKVDNLPPEDQMVYEAWLVDIDTGYKLSLGAFTTQDTGRGDLRFNQDFVDYNLYDLVVITKEPMHDVDPRPGTIVLSTSIPDSTRGNSFELFAPIEGRNEVPAVATNAGGFGTFTINTSANTLTYHIRSFALQNETMAHIHGIALPGENAGAVHTLPGGEVKDGVWNYPEELEAAIIGGQMYVNVHTTQNPSGEIRGQILPIY